MTFSLVQAITFVASCLGLVSHAAQLFRSWRSGSTSGLSLPTFCMLTVTFSLTIVMGIQYRIGPALVLTVISTAMTVAVLGLLSFRILVFYLALVAAVAAAVLFGPPAIAEAVTTTRYAEVVAFSWGLLFAIAFVPQVIKAHRLRDTRDLSRVSLLVSGCAIGLWLTFAILVRNYSMLFWLTVVMLSQLELIRLKLTEGTRAPRAGAPNDAETKAARKSRVTV